MTYAFCELERLLIDPMAQHNEGPVQALAGLLGVNVNTIYRSRRSGLTAEMADRLAIRAGYHPWNIWGDEWFRDAGECAACDASDRLCGRHEQVRVHRLICWERRHDAIRLTLWWARVDRYAETMDFGALNPSSADTPGVECGDHKEVVPAQCDLPGTVASPYGRETSEMDHTPPVVGVAS